MKKEKARIIANKQIGQGFMHLTIEAPHIACDAKPGQFAMLRINQSLDPVLGRPLCFYRMIKSNGLIEFVYKIIGKGTRMLAEKKLDDLIDIIGPLGKGWTLLPDTKQIGIVGRGIGIAPLICLAEYAREKDVAVKAFLSAKQIDMIIGRELLGQLECELYLHSEEDKGNINCNLVTDHLENILGKERIDQLYVCGSKRLGQKVLEYSKSYGMNSQISLEERMACGLGACVGCVTEVITERGKGKKEYQRVCKEGPVFWVEEVAALYDYKPKG